VKFSLLILLAFCFFSYAEVPFHRTIYEDDPKLKELGIEVLKEAYGADSLIILPPQGTPPPKPKILPGVILHTDSFYDPDWVIGSLKTDPIIRSNKIERLINDDLGLKDIDGKFDEFIFLSKFAQNIAPPDTEFISAFKEEALSQSSIEKIRTLVETHKSELSKTNINTESLISQCLKLEAIRLSIQRSFGKSILKRNISFHSEGKLPKTIDDWPSLYLFYVLKTKPQIKQLTESLSSSSVPIEDKIIDLPFIEGGVLEAVLETPQEVVAQKMVKIGVEVRVHIVNGRILDGGTLLRYFELGEYLDPEKLELIHRTLEKEFLEKVRRHYSDFSASPDVIIEADSGKIRIIDLNCGLESGYYYPEEDIFTTNLIAEYFSKRKPRFLQMFDEFQKAPDSFSRIRILRSILKRYKPFITENSESAFWDRVWQIYRKRLYANPSQELFHNILQEMYQAGLHSPWFFYEYISEIENSLPKAKLTNQRAEFWIKKLNALKGGVIFDKSPNGITAHEEIEPNCAHAFQLIA